MSATPHTSACPHPPASVAPGPRVPLRWGSSATEICGACGAYRLLFRDGLPWQPGPPDVTEPEED